MCNRKIKTNLLSFALAQIDSVFVAKFKRNNKNTQELRRTRDRKKRKKSSLASFYWSGGVKVYKERAGGKS
jgi:hypothetical protein